MKLLRPLVVFDLETTGPRAYADRIVQVAVLKAYPDGRVTEWQTLVNPGRHIPAAATAVHGITDEMVKDAPTFWSIARNFEKGFTGCDVAGFNVLRFDWPMLVTELGRVGVEAPAVASLVDAMRVFHKFHPRNLGAAVRQYLGREHEGAHDALADAKATLEVLKAQVAKHQNEMPEEPGAIAAWLDGKETANAA